MPPEEYVRCTGWNPSYWVSRTSCARTSDGGESSVSSAKMQTAAPSYPCRPHHCNSTSSIPVQGYLGSNIEGTESAIC
ncbi:hypothetical protein C8Q78DRAFT_1041580 [Trametes maxima]|nr:hypothetical protein C8Q78DRAFT_1041580 [Trametes maxima]